MEKILSTLQSANLDLDVFLKSSAILALGGLLLGVLSRYIFGKKSYIFHSVSSAIGIIFVYAVAIVVYSLLPNLSHIIPELPFVTFNESNMTLFVFTGSHYTTICTQLLQMIMLAFFANLLDSCIPAGKNIFLWLLGKCVTVIGAIILHLLLSLLIERFLPHGLVTYSPTILLGLLLLLLLVGCLKFFVGAILSNVHPIVGAFYTFFFATIVGKSLTKALLTTTILSGLLFALKYIGCYSISIASAALVAYIPLVVVLAFTWYIINRLSK